MKILVPEEAREKLGIRRKTNFEHLTRRPESLALFMEANVTCERCLISKYCKDNFKVGNDCDDVWLKWLLKEREE